MVFIMAFVSMNAQNQKMKIAVMDFRPGVGVSQSETEGLSDMLINTLFQTGKFEIIERTQIDQAKKELKFQETEPTYEQIAQMGRFLGVEAVLVGTVNKLFDEYNVDVRAINVESAKVVTTAGRSLDKKSASAFRKMMEKLGKELADNLIEEKTVVVEEVKKPVVKKNNFRKSGFTLRPEVGFNIPILYYNDQIFQYSPSVELAIGYQAGPHFFFGIIGGFGGRINYTYTDYYKPDYNEPATERAVTMTDNIFPIKADIRWYLIDHEYSFIIDVQGGITGISHYYDNDWNTLGETPEKHFDPSGTLKVNLGFAIKNVEASLGGLLFWEAPPAITVNVAYRFGNVIKKWW